MINKLICDIKKYVEYLEKQKIYVSIHTNFTEYMLPLIEYNIHKNPKCLLIKSDNEAWDRCIKQHSNDFHDKSDVKFRVCHANVEEFIFFLECGGSVCTSQAEKNDPEELYTLVKPLCRMIEYLKLICPETELEITDNELINRVIKFVQRNFYNQISTVDIAKNCFCSVSTVCHRFKQYKGISIGKYIFDLRLSYAKELLKTSNLSVSSIAQKSGFSCYNYFAITFKKETGLSPSIYRKLNCIKSE
ncbi:MAG: AraC family transcriptional regulator [Bacillota bacterium]|nr:AraC family transcriptional regulator [Bacillota bacterium]